MRLPRIHGLALVAGLAACSTTSPPIPGGPNDESTPITIRSPLDELVNEHGYRPLDLYVGPGGHADAGVVLQPSLKIGLVEGNLPLEPASVEAGFLRSWTFESRVEDDLDLLVKLTGDETSAANLEAALARSRLSKFSLTIGEAHVETIRLSDVRRLVREERLDYEEMSALRAGYPVIASALVVDSVRLSFDMSNAPKMTADIPVIADLLGASVSSTPSTDESILALDSTNPLIIGILATQAFEPPPPPPLDAPDVEPNNSMSEAAPMRASGYANGVVGEHGDGRDFYVITASRRGELTFTLTNTSSKGPQVSAAIYLSNGKRFGTISRRSGGRSKTLGKSLTLAPGEQAFIEVKNNPSRGAVAYEVESSFAATR